MSMSRSVLGPQKPLSAHVPPPGGVGYLQMPAPLPLATVQMSASKTPLMNSPSLPLISYEPVTWVAVSVVITTLLTVAVASVIGNTAESEEHIVSSVLRP